MKELRYINAVKWFASTVFAVYIGAMLYPWLQIAFGYVPVAQPQDSVSLSPAEYATAVSLTVLFYGGMFAIPLLIASLYTIKSLRTKYNRLHDSQT